MKKLVKVLLSLTLICLSVNPVFADDSNSGYTISSAALNDAVIEVVEGDLFRLSITTGTETDYLELNYLDKLNEETVYNWILDKDDFVSYNTDDFIDYAQSNLEEANGIVIQNVDVPTVYSSANADILEQLREKYGEEDTIRKAARFSSEYDVEIYEDWVFRVNEDKTKSWTSPLSISSLIVNVLNEVVDTTLVNALCQAMGVAISYASMLEANGSIKIYNADAFFTRYATINSDGRIYNVTDKYVNNKAYENNSPQNEERAYVDFGSETVVFTDTESYYNNFTLQMDDAIENYNLYN